MKSIIKEKQAKQAEVKYPCLMVSNKDSLLIVLFEDDDTGILIYQEEVIYTVGKQYSGWSKGQTKLFTPFDGVVELSND